MKTAVLAFVTLLLHSVCSSAQSGVCSDQGTVALDTVAMEVTIPPTVPNSKSCVAAWEYVIERSSGGQISYRIDPGSIHFSGDPVTINSLSTIQVFDLIATATVSNGVVIGATPCPSSCTTPSYATVVQPSCVTRGGNGENTYFSACFSTGCCRRTYSVCCPNGPNSPQIVLVSAQSSTCIGMGGGCESTCP